MKRAIIAAAITAAFVSIATQVPAAECVPQSVLTWVDNREATAISPTRWQNVRKTLLEQDGGMSLEEMETIYNRRLANNWDASHWPPIINAVKCLQTAELEVEEEQPQPVQEEDPPLIVAEEETPITAQAPAPLTSCKKPAVLRSGVCEYKAPTTYDGYFGWNAPAAPNAFPQSCKNKIAQMDKEIRESNWALSVVRKYGFEPHANRSNFYCRSHSKGGGSCSVGNGFATTTQTEGPNGEKKGQWKWTRPPYPYNILPNENGLVPATLTDINDKLGLAHYGFIECGVSHQQYYSTHKLDVGILDRNIAIRSDSVDEGQTKEVRFYYKEDNGNDREYTIALEGTAEKGDAHSADADYIVEVKGTFKFDYYHNTKFQTESSWFPVPASTSRIRIKALASTNGGGPTSVGASLRISTNTDSDGTEGPETVIVRLENPTPYKHILDYTNRVSQACVRWEQRTLQGRTQRYCVERRNFPAGWSLGTQLGYGGAWGFQNYSDPNRRKVTLTINDASGESTDIKKRVSVAINDLTLQEGDKGPEIRAVGCAPNWWKNEGGTDQQWCGGYHPIATATLPADVCVHGYLQMTGGTATPYWAEPNEPRGDFNAFSFLRSPKGRGRTYTMCGDSGIRRYITTYRDSHNEGSETATITFVPTSVTEGRWGPPHARLRVSDVAVTPGTLTINNDGPLPREYLAQFGHAVAGNVVDAITSRIDAPRTAGRTGALGMLPAEGETVGLSQVLEGAQGSATSPSGVAVWGRIGVSRFDATQEVNVKGDSTHVTAGADYRHRDWLLGVALGHDTTEGTYGEDGEEAEASLTLAAPYVAYYLGERTSVWASAGAGTGDVRLRPLGRDEWTGADTEWLFGALGARSEVFARRNVKMTAFGDVFGQEIESADGQELAASSSQSWRARAGVSSSVDLGALSVTPNVALRHDAGDVGEDTAVDVGVGSTVALGAWTVTGDWSKALGSGNSYDSLSGSVEYGSSWGAPSVALSDAGVVYGWEWEPQKDMTLGATLDPKTGAAQGTLGLRF